MKIDSSDVSMSSSEVSVELEAAADLSLAMVANDVPLIRRLSLTNRGAGVVRDVTVSARLEPQFSQAWSAHITEIPVGGTHTFELVELPLDRARLVNQLEREDGSLVVTATAADGRELARHSVVVGVLAYNEWSATTVPQIIAAFVIPNHPTVAHILNVARDHVRRITGDPALDGYQSRSSARVRGMVQGIYETIQALDVTYSNPPASFETTGQKIRTPEQVLDQRMGTCLDLSVLMAACLEQIGLHPLVAVIQGHALPAVWLQDQELAEGACDDGLRLRKYAELDRLIAFDSSAVATRPVMTFAHAVRKGHEYLGEPTFRYAVDIRAARRQRFLPLPARVVGAYSTVEAAPTSVAVSGPSGAVPATEIPLQPGSAAARAAKIPRIEKWKQRLLDTTLRNRLLNFKADGKQVLRLLGKDIAGLENVLVRGGALQLLPHPGVFDENDPRKRQLVNERLGDDALEALVRERRDRGALHLDIPPHVLWGRATEIFRAARESIEESGTNTLCLALGMLHWYESDASEERRLAPILLLPVTLKRDARSSSFELTLSGEETRLNATLIEKLRGEHGISIPELAELPEDEAGVDVAAVMNAMRGAVVNLRRWEVVSEAYLANFSFAKFLMWADLEQRAASLLESPVVEHLVNGKGKAFPSTGTFTEPEELDRRYAPADLLCPLDADASQLSAVAAAADGRSFVLQGPPGTGKSQTITNLIAHCLANGKRVLFVAEKVAALDVVHRRLSRIGLAPFCLELHSNKTSKQHVLDQLQAALEVPTTAPPASWEASAAQLLTARDALNAYAEALHRDRGGLTVFRAFSRLTCLREARRIDLLDVCSTTPAQIDATVKAADELCNAVAALPELATVAWRGCELPSWDLGLTGRVRDTLGRLGEQLDAVTSAGAALAARLGVVPPSSLTEANALGETGALIGDAPNAGGELLAGDTWPEVEATATALVRAGRTRSEAETALAPRYSDQLFALDLGGLKARFDRYARSFFLVAWWMLRGARKTLAAVAQGARLGRATQIVDDLQMAITAREQAAMLERLDSRGRGIFGPLWSAAQRDWDAMERATSWARDIRASLKVHRHHGDLASLLQAGNIDREVNRAGTILRSNVQAVRATARELETLLGWHPGEPAVHDELGWLREQVDRWQAQVHLLREWFSYQQALRGLREGGAMTLADAVDGCRIPGAAAPGVAERSALEAWLIRTTSSDPALRSFHGDPQRALVETFASRDRALLRDAGTMVQARLAARTMRGGGEVAGTSELGILQRELKKKTRHKPIRKLFREIPETLARLKPCFLMSPLSVAQYLEPGAVKFDVVVFDEASQIPTHDAIGALARGHSAVVVGDSKQLPPTSFFQQSDDGKEIDEDDFEELESILDECCAVSMPERRLDWHYRSRHEDLIAFSNHRYYGNRLNTFPSSSSRVPRLGVSLRQIEGIYDKGQARTNRAEADAVVQELVTRLVDPEQSRRSYGIVTFSQAQQKLVEDLLDQERRKREGLDRFFDDSTAEPVIVKNLENIQGDERDVMLFSICYGPDRLGVVGMNFGPLNRDGGERRLNVAVTRAREELIVFSTLRPDQIDLRKTQARGVSDLKTFLDYAQRGPRAIAEALEVSGEARFDSPFEEQVHRVLTARGWSVETQVGCAGYRIDLGIRHPEQPGRFVLGVECDGAFYHSARSARERDRLRAEVLEKLGWRLHRIWSTDWWIDPNREMDKLEQAIKAVLAAPVARTPVVSKPEGSETAPPPVPPVLAPSSRPATAQEAPSTATRRRDTSVQAYVQPLMRTSVGSSPGAPAAELNEGTSSRPYEIASVASGRRGPDDLHDARHEAELRQLVAAVVAAEAPLSLGLLAKRIAPHFTIARSSQRVITRLQSVLGAQVALRGQFIWKLEQVPESYREFRVAAAEARRDAGDIATEEIANAAAHALRANVALSHDELVKQTARTLGFGRTGDRVAERMAEGIHLLVNDGRARRDADRVVYLRD